jgi:hypothetical protein
MGKGITKRGGRPVKGRHAGSVAIRENGVPGKGGESCRTRGCTPRFLPKSAQPMGKTLDSCDPRNERVRKCLKTRRDECEELLSIAGEQRGEENRGVVRTIRRG